MEKAMRWNRRLWAAIFLLGILTVGVGAEEGRSIPEPAPENPGNIFYFGTPVEIAASDAMLEQGARWELYNVDGEPSGPSGPMSEVLSVGQPEPGWYEVRVFDKDDGLAASTTMAVLEPLAAPVPSDSPINVDAATSWFSRDDAEEQALRLRLAALAGVNWVRDRYTWPLVMPEEDVVEPKTTTFDTAAEITDSLDLQLLQTFHSAPVWARDPELDPSETGKRFPRDLRDLYAFSRVAAERYKGQAIAWEPWNEANITGFGGHLVNEMCTLQKAAWWGYKQVDPSITVCWNTYAGSGSETHHEGVLRNEAYAYFDTYNFHSYKPVDVYTKAFAPALKGAAGRPLWLTECGIHLEAETEEPWGDLSPGSARKQARFIPKSFATAIYSGVDMHFFFILGNYIERGTQFGVLRHDFTPRPGYVALANTGRMLAGAEALGHVSGLDESIRAYAFAAEPYGRMRDVVVLWAEEESEWPFQEDLPLMSVRDLYGRVIDAPPAEIGPDVLYLEMARGSASALEMEAPAEDAPRLEAEPSPVVLQVVMPQGASLLQKQAYEVDVEKEVEVPLHVYNFGEQAVEGSFRVSEHPSGWTASVPPQSVSVKPGERKSLVMTAELPPEGESVVRGDWITIRGDFGETGAPVLSFRLAGATESLKPSERMPLENALHPSRWERNASPGTDVEVAETEDGLHFKMDFPYVKAWSYPILELEESERAPADADGLALNIRRFGDPARVRVQFIEEGGSIYLGETDTPRLGDDASKQAVVLFEEATWRAATPADEDGALTPEDIERIMVGVNTKPEADVAIAIRDLAWVKY